MSRPSLHFQPASGRFGDPIPIVHEGRVHVFFQNAPRPDAFGEMRWAHVVTDDLLRWTQVPDALVPEPGGPDAFGCWTGCVIRHGGRFLAFYTGVAGEDGRHQAVCLAESDDLTHWRKDPRNPLVVAEPPFAVGERAAWRDPQVRRLPDGSWEMVLAAEVSGGPAASRGCVARLTSDDLRAWRVDGVLYHPGDVHRCECPEVVPLGGGHALLYSDYGVQVRVAEGPRGPYARPAATVLDDFRWYAAKTAVAGERRLAFGFAFERLGGASGAVDDGAPWTWGGTMAFPRELVAGPDGAPALRPIAELDHLRSEPVAIEPDLDGATGAWRVASGPGSAVAAGRPGGDDAGRPTGSSAEAMAILRLGRLPTEAEATVQVRWPEDGEVGLILRADAGLASGYRLDVDRRRGALSLRRLMPLTNPASPVLQRMDLPLDLPDVMEVRAFLDGDLLEVFLAGRVAFTGRLHDLPPVGFWGVATRSPATFEAVRAWCLAAPS